MQYVQAFLTVCAICVALYAISIAKRNRSEQRQIDAESTISNLKTLAMLQVSTAESHVNNVNSFRILARSLPEGEPKYNIIESLGRFKTSSEEVLTLSREALEETQKLTAEGVTSHREHMSIKEIERTLNEVTKLSTSNNNSLAALMEKAELKITPRQ